MDNRLEFATKLAKKTHRGVQETKVWIKQFSELLLEEILKEDKVQFKNFGAFKVCTLPERTRMNLKTKELTTYPPVKMIRFETSKHWKDVAAGRAEPFGEDE